MTDHPLGLTVDPDDPTPPAGAVLLICEQCCGRFPSDALVMVFPDVGTRSEWRDEHVDATGHGMFWLCSVPLSYRRALAAYAHDVEQRDRLRAGRTLDDPADADQVIAYLREALAHTGEWVGPGLTMAQARALVDRLDALTSGLPEVECPSCATTIRARLADRTPEPSDRLTAIAREFWAPYRPHGGKDRAVATMLCHWPEMYRLMQELPNPHKPGEGS